MRLTFGRGLGPGIGSNTTGRIPANPSSRASISPSGPAPAMTTSITWPAQLPAGSGDHRNTTHQRYLRVYLLSDSLRNAPQSCHAASWAEPPNDTCSWQCLSRQARAWELIGAAPACAGRSRTRSPSAARSATGTAGLCELCTATTPLVPHATPLFHSPANFPCRLIVDTTAHLHGVVRKAFIEPTQQGDIAGCCDAMLPLCVHQGAEWPLVELID